MKKLITTIVFAFVLTNLSAQTETEKTTTTFNKWSIELAGGLNGAVGPFSPGYYSESPGLFTVDLGARYMFNNKFGLKADFGYNNIEAKSDSKDFNTKYYRFDVQGVANLGRMMNFETWTKTIGLLGHSGFGVGYLDGDKFADKDYVANFIAGITGQIRLTEKFALTADLSTIYNAKQDLNFDGAGINPETRGFTGNVLTGTIGLTYYLGNKGIAADWSADNKDALEVEALKEKIAKIETQLLDTDMDGVADYIDQEPNTISGVMVDTKGRAIDTNKNSVPDELERYLEKTYQKVSGQSSNPQNNEVVKNLINDGYVVAYFDSNSSTPTAFSTNGINFILTYFKNNPTATMDIIGHADEIGSTSSNNKLALARAKNIKDVLVNAKIDASRLNVISAGENATVNAKSEQARQLVRTVTFKLK
jgi:OOP family OmpA-OmpF porin